MKIFIRLLFVLFLMPGITNTVCASTITESIYGVATGRGAPYNPWFSLGNTYHLFDITYDNTLTEYNYYFQNTDTISRTIEADPLRFYFASDARITLSSSLQNIVSSYAVDLSSSEWSKSVREVYSSMEDQVIRSYSDNSHTDGYQLSAAIWEGGTSRASFWMYRPGSSTGQPNYSVDFTNLSGYSPIINHGPPPAPTPEPSTMFLFGLGLLGFAGANRKLQIISNSIKPKGRRGTKGFVVLIL